jgi:hypothetical protein
MVKKELELVWDKYKNVRDKEYKSRNTCIYELSKIYQPIVDSKEVETAFVLEFKHDGDHWKNSSKSREGGKMVKKNPENYVIILTICIFWKVLQTD